MNKSELNKNTRIILKELLGKCTMGQQDVFVRMYGQNKYRSITETVDHMDSEKIDWALTQIENTLIKNENNKQ